MSVGKLPRVLDFSLKARTTFTSALLSPSSPPVLRLSWLRHHRTSASEQRMYQPFYVAGLLLAMGGFVVQRGQSDLTLISRSRCRFPIVRYSLYDL